MAVCAPQGLLTYFDFSDIEGLDEAPKTLLKLLLLKVVDSDHEIRVSGFDTVFFVEVFDKGYVADINLLTLFLIAKCVIKTGYHSHCT